MASKSWYTSTTVATANNQSADSNHTLKLQTQSRWAASCLTYSLRNPSGLCKIEQGRPTCSSWWQTTKAASNTTSRCFAAHIHAHQSKQPQVAWLLHTVPLRLRSWFGGQRSKRKRNHQKAPYPSSTCSRKSGLQQQVIHRMKGGCMHIKYMDALTS